MGLDVYLIGGITTEECQCYSCGHVHTKEVQDCKFNANITHNLGRMAEAAGIYKALWRPEEINCVKAKDIVDILLNGLIDMMKRPDHYKQFNASNGWGTYDAFVPWVEEYLMACIKYPEATISVSR